MPFLARPPACPYLGPKNTPRIFVSAIQQPDSEWRAIINISCINSFTCIGSGTEAHLSTII
jgi:hypothetical protein